MGSGLDAAPSTEPERGAEAGASIRGVSGEIGTSLLLSSAPTFLLGGVLE